ncbi:MAG: hypothetical protein ACI841_002999 [Planctomycetota bacterium]|jgi:hypothetical protein
MTDFRLLRMFNQPEQRKHARSRMRVGRASLALFTGDNLFEKIIREIGAERIISLKEVCEAFEFFALTRKYLRAPVIADLCSGHGLVGILFAAAERKTTRVLLCDRRRPKNFDLMWNAARRAAPWIEDKVEYLVGDLAKTRDQLPQNCSIAAVHACGKLSDTSLEIASSVRGAAAVMPCCRDHTHNPGPLAVAQKLGGDLAYDIDRTYRMEAAGYQVRWRDIPEEITPMNRVLIATPRSSITAMPASEPAR